MPKKIERELPKLKLVDSKTIGERVAEIRKERGLTQLELSSKVGIIRRLLGDYELGNSRIYGEMITRLAVALEVSTDRLLGLEKGDNTTEEISLRYTKRIKEIESLSEYKKRIVLKAIDDSIKANKN